MDTLRGRRSKLNTPVVGVALGVPLSRVITGPFYQFQNMDDSEGDITKLVGQLARRVPGLELDSDVVKVQVGTFKTTAAALLKTLTVGGGTKETKAEVDDSPIAKLVEEMKALPLRVAERLVEVGGDPIRRRKMRRFHPMMFEELMHFSGSDDPVSILMVASMVRDDAPWLYELAMEVYKALKSGDRAAIESEMARIRQFSEFTMRGPFMEEFGFSGGKDAQMFLMEFPRMLDHMLRRTLESKTAGPLGLPGPGRGARK